MFAQVKLCGKGESGVVPKDVFKVIQKGHTMNSLATYLTLDRIRPLNVHILLCIQIEQSGTVPIWVTLTWLPEQVTLNVKCSQQLPKRVTVSVRMRTDTLDSYPFR